MKPFNRPVTSREYKLILNADRFKDRDDGIKMFWNLVEFLVIKQGGKILKEQDEEKERCTWYLDTPSLDLRRQNYVLRVREEAEEPKKKFKVTLKNRYPDRYISAGQDLSTIEKGNYKFEEDILPPFTSKFSHSTSVKYKKEPNLSTIDKIATIFPGVATLNIDADTPIVKVNNFEANEIARWVGQLKFEKEPIVKACLSFWYLIGAENELPLIVEFSFDYDVPADTLNDPSKLEHFPIPVVAGAYKFFGALQRQSDWINFDATTKTAYAYEAL